jgi:hypothetical protein
MAYKYPNVKSSKWDVAKGEHIEIDVHEHMMPFIDALAVKYPHWEFVSANIRYTGEDNNTPKSCSFKVFNDENPRVEIGDVKSSYKYDKNGKNVPSYVVYNSRLAMDRERGHTFETIKLPLAMKAVNKYFNPPPVVEILEQVLERGVGQYKQAVVFKGRHVQNTEYHLESSQKAFVKANWEAYKASVDPTTLEVVERYETQVDECRRIANIENNNNFYAVVIHKDQYVVSFNDKITTYDVNTIPIELRAQLGLLKLVEEGDLLEDVGVRTKEGFLVFLPKDEVNEVS